MFVYTELYIMGRTKEISRETAAAVWGERDLVMMEEMAEFNRSGVYESEDGLRVEYEED